MILWDLQNLRKAIRQLEERVADLDAKVHNITQTYSAMPKGGSGHNDMVERYILLKDKLESKKEDYEQMLITVEMRIADVQDPFISSIMSYRHIDNYSWVKVAHKVGGGNTADSCRMAEKRYLKRHFDDFC